MTKLKTLSMISTLALGLCLSAGAQAQSLTAKNDARVNNLTTLQAPAVKGSAFGSAQAAAVGASASETVSLNGVYPTSLSFAIKGNLKAVNEGQVANGATINGAVVKDSAFGSTTAQAAGAVGSVGVSLNGFAFGLDPKVAGVDINVLNKGNAGNTAVFNNPTLQNSNFGSIGSTAVGASAGLSVNVNLTPTP